MPVRCRDKKLHTLRPSYDLAGLQPSTELAELKVGSVQERRGVVHFKVFGKGSKTRFVPAHPAALDAINKAIVVELQEQGIAAPSGTIVKNKYVLHVAHTNHRSRREDFDVPVREVIRIGKMEKEISSK